MGAARGGRYRLWSARQRLEAGSGAGRGDRVETVAAAKQALREVAQCRTVAGTVADHGGYFARRLAAADDVETAAKRALAAKGVTGDEIDTTMQRAERKARKEWDL